MSDIYPLFPKYAPAIMRLPAGDLAQAQLQVPALEVAREEPLRMYFAPFEYLNHAARVILIGITPGFTQMAIALRVARQGLYDGIPVEQIGKDAKREASFAGTMRTNLVDMLDGTGVQALLGIESCGLLFGARQELVHTTSAVRYPVFVHGKNYSGRRPPLVRSPLLRQYVTHKLSAELRAIPQALIIPLGHCVSSAITCLISAGKLDQPRCVIGFPHPSGNNGWRVRQYSERRTAMRRQVAAWKPSRHTFTKH